MLQMRELECQADLGADASLPFTSYEILKKYFNF